MPANTDLIITHPKVMAAPEKLKDVVIHKTLQASTVTSLSTATATTLLWTAPG